MGMQLIYIPDDLTEAARKVAHIKLAEGRSRKEWLAVPDIREFPIKNYGYLTIDNAHQIALDKFGKAAPSRSAIGRFYKAVTDHIRRSAANGLL